MPVKKWEIAIDLLKEVYGTLQMFLFIIEEAQQTMGMAIYLSYQAGEYDQCKTMAQYAITEVIDPALDWIETYGFLLYPTQISYKEFFQASKISMERFISLCSS